MAQHQYSIFETAGGFCGIAWNEIGIIRFQLPTKSAGSAESLLLRKLDEVKSAPPPADVLKAIETVRRYFSGETMDFTGIRLDLQDQDDFFQDIYAAARRIGYGHTITYGAIAKELGVGPQAARDVGQAMAKNPVPLIIPCHRVLAAGGKLGGFSAPGGAVSKARMLEMEGVRLPQLEPAQQSLGL